MTRGQASKFILSSLAHNHDPDLAPDLDHATDLDESYPVRSTAVVKALPSFPPKTEIVMVLFSFLLSRALAST
jgi:hypothetical protein